MKKHQGILIKTIPAVVGIGFAWLGTTLIKNEKRLLIRRLELEEALVTKSNKLRKKLLLGG